MNRFDLNILNSERLYLEEKVKNYFPGGKIVNGDKGYKRLLELLEETNRQIEDILIKEY
jgi:hypothetical protein